MKYKLTFALVASLTSTAFAEFKAPLPEFKNEKQLAEWRAEKAFEANSQDHTAEETTFYTGKPYLASSGDYAFKYRNYSPEVARWTTEDPSGFPDGANGNLYAPCPTSGIDWCGLVKVSFTTPHFTVTGSSTIECWAEGEFEYELDQQGGYTFTKNTGAWTSVMYNVSTDNALGWSVALGNFTASFSQENGVNENGGKICNVVEISANFNVTDKVNGNNRVLPHSALKQKFSANWKTAE